MIGNRRNLHALHEGAGAVIAEGGAGGQQRVAAAAIGVEQRMNGRINTIEQANLRGFKRMGQARPTGATVGEIGDHRLAQALIFRVNGELIGRDGMDRLHHLGAGTDRVLVEIEPQQASPPLQRSAVGLQCFHLGPCRWPGARGGNA